MKFEEYYRYYLTLHKNKWCRRLHILGQLATITFVFLIIYFSIAVSVLFLPLLLFFPFVVYVYAWTGHFVFEKNEPAAFKNPIWAKISDWRMTWDIIRGKIPF